MDERIDIIKKAVNENQTIRNIIIEEIPTEELIKELEKRGNIKK